MSYETFCRRVSDIAKKAGTSVRFSTNKEEGKHYAKCSDGTTIIGNSMSLKLTLNWGSGHTAMVAV